MTYRIFFVLLFALSGICTAQDETTKIDGDSKEADVPFAVIDQVPVYPGCDGSENEVQKQCMVDKIGQLVSENFNMKLIESLQLKPGKYRTAVQFKIDKKGAVVDVRARNTNGSEAVEKEAIRVVSLIPKMKPGIQRGIAVGVLYALPIIFEVEPPKRIQRRKQQNKDKNR